MRKQDWEERLKGLKKQDWKNKIEKTRLKKQDWEDKIEKTRLGRQDWKNKIEERLHQSYQSYQSSSIYINLKNIIYQCKSASNKNINTWNTW